MGERRRWEEEGRNRGGAHRRSGARRRLAGGGVTRQRRRACGTLPGGTSRKEEVHGRRRRCGEMGFGWPRSGCSGPWCCWWLGELTRPVMNLQMNLQAIDATTLVNHSRFMFTCSQ